MSRLYLIASLKHTISAHEHITFWGADHRGYVLVVTEERGGRYTEQEAARLNDGIDCIAVPEDVVMALRTPTPYFANSFGKAARFYDIPGPVVDNTRENWARLIEAALPREGKARVKPEVFKGRRRSFTIEGVQP